jgi:hypothetical protein
VGHEYDLKSGRDAAKDSLAKALFMEFDGQLMTNQQVTGRSKSIAGVFQDA